MPYTTRPATNADIIVRTMFSAKKNLLFKDSAPFSSLVLYHDKIWHTLILSVQHVNLAINSFCQIGLGDGLLVTFGSLTHG